MTVLHMAVLLLSLAGFIALAMAMPKHSKQVLRRHLPDSLRRVMRGLGWTLLAVGLGLGIAQWQFDVGTVTWLGWLTIAGVALVFYLPKWPGQPESKPTRARKRKGNVGGVPGPSSVVVSRRSRSMRFGIATFALLLPFGAFAWQLLNTPDKPLLRDDALHGEIGPWSFSLAEKDQKPPEVVALDVPLKAFVIRFCDGCERDIRMAYLKVREPRFSSDAAGALRSAGNAFEGRGQEKTAEIPVPRAATLDDGLWLTVEATNGEVHHQRFDIQRLSPAMAQFIREDI